jgi:hypothetical protein
MAVSKLFVYHVESGKILATADYDDQGDSGPPGPRAAEFGQVDPVSHYAPSGEITARPANPVQLNSTVVTADGFSEVVLSNVPNPSKVTVQHVTEGAPFIIEVVDGQLGVTFNRPGGYTIKVDSFPIQDVVFNVQALAP